MALPHILGILLQRTCLRSTGYLRFGRIAQCVAHTLTAWLAARLARMPRKTSSNQRPRRLGCTRVTVTAPESARPSHAR
jgi:hypothetical protein